MRERRNNLAINNTCEIYEIRFLQFISVFFFFLSILLRIVFHLSLSRCAHRRHFWYRASAGYYIISNDSRPAINNETREYRVARFGEANARVWPPRSGPDRIFLRQTTATTTTTTLKAWVTVYIDPTACLRWLSARTAICQNQDCITYVYPLAPLSPPLRLILFCRIFRHESVTDYKIFLSHCDFNPLLGIGAFVFPKTLGFVGRKNRTDCVRKAPALSSHARTCRSAESFVYRQKVY